ncbi:MAG: nitroreductase family protein [Oscillospiraceae bacterium]|nr:nitroreductase family protein [Oscillospiraceae bacterium]
MDFFTVIENRHSYRGAYTDSPVPKSDLEKIADAGLRAPSGCNEQTTSLIVVTDAALREKIAGVLDHKSVRSAPALIIVTTRYHKFDFGLAFELEDYAAAVENILLAATAMGYASCWFDGMVRTGGRDKAIAEILGAAEDENVRCILPVGVPAQIGKQAPRKPFDERVTWKQG